MARGRGAGSVERRGFVGMVVGLLVGTLLLGVWGCGGKVSAEGEVSSVPHAIEKLRNFYASRDYFRLAEALDALGPGVDPGPPEVLYYRAAVAHARNRPAASNRLIEQALSRVTTVPEGDRLVARLERLRYRNHLREGHYGEALRALEAALEALPSGTVGSAASPGSMEAMERKDLENEARILRALRGVPPPTVARGGAAVVERLPNTRVPVRIGGRERAYVLDTGANLSVMMRSEVDSLELVTRPAGVEVGTATGGTVRADVAVAGQVEIGTVSISHVVFLVLPDEALTFAGGRFTIPGILGFPVLEALGEVGFRGTESLRMPAVVPEEGPWNLALHYLTPLVRVGVLGDTVICQLDTGAGTTSFYSNFYQTRRETFHRLGRPDSARFAGVGGERVVPSYVLPEVPLEVGDTTVVLPELEAYTEPLSEREGVESLGCNLGLDVVNAYDAYVLNLRSMTFRLR